MKKQLILIFGFFIFYLVSFVQITHAQDATESTTINPAETTQQLKERIQRIVEEKSEQIKGAIDQISTRKRGFIGQVSRVTQESLTITNAKGTEIIPFNDQVTLLKNNKEIPIDEVVIDDWLIVMGLIIDDAFVPKRILVSSTNLRPAEHLATMGTITKQTKNELILLSRQNEELIFTINKKTQYQDRDGSEAESQTFIKDLQVIVVGQEDEEGKLATVIRSLVQLDTLQN